MKEPQRIAKLLARAGVASRREIERMIEERRVAIGGKAIETPATLVTSLHGVTVDGRPVADPAPARLFLYHKPAGVLTAARDPSGRATIYDRMPEGMPRVMPVGRLDLNTEGLLLLTTDGEFKRALELPSNGVERTYRARAYGQVAQADLETLSEGIEIEGVRYGSIDANIERRTGANVWIEMRLREGKNREVRRVLEHLGLEVNRLIRVAYGPFVLADLPIGEAGEVRQHDLVAFRKNLRGGGGSDAGAISAAPMASHADTAAPSTPARRETRSSAQAPASKTPERKREGRAKAGERPRASSPSAKARAAAFAEGSGRKRESSGAPREKEREDQRAPAARLRSEFRKGGGRPDAGAGRRGSGRAAGGDRDQGATPARGANARGGRPAAPRGERAGPATPSRPPRTQFERPPGAPTDRSAPGNRRPTPRNDRAQSGDEHIPRGAGRPVADEKAAKGHGARGSRDASNLRAERLGSAGSRTRDKTSARPPVPAAPAPSPRPRPPKGSGPKRPGTRRPRRDDA